MRWSRSGGETGATWEGRRRRSVLRGSPPRLHSCLLAAAAALSSPARAAECETSARDVIAPVHLPFEAPEGIAADADGSLWVASLLSNEVLHLSDSLAVIGRFADPFGDGREVTGIAYHPLHDTLFLAQPVLKEVREVEKDGKPTGLVIPLAGLPAPPNIIPETFIKGIAIDPNGDRGAGSLWVMEGVLTAIYEVSFTGEILRSFCHPYDPDGCPGKGNATHSGDIKLIVEGGTTVGVEILGARAGRYRLLRVNLAGEVEDLVYPLDQVGGRPMGFARGRARNPRTGELREALFVGVESSAEIHALEFDAAPAIPPQELEGTKNGARLDLSWRNPQPYAGIEVLRDGELIARLEGTAGSHIDPAPPGGILDYELAADAGPCMTRARLRAVLGLGEVLHHAVVDPAAAGRRELQLPVGIAEDRNGNLWVTDALRNVILVFDKDLNPVLPAPLPSPFRGESDSTSGIAFNPAGEGSLFIYNAASNVVAEINDAGELLGEPFPSGVPTDPEFEAMVTAMLHDPAGAGGAGSFWYLDFTTSSIQERTRAGDLLRMCIHPDAAAENPPEQSYLAVYAWGMTPASPPPWAGPVPSHPFASLHLSGGRARDLGTTRILRLETTSCEALGEEVPAEGMALTTAPIVLGIHRTVHGGRDVLYAVHSSFASPFIFEISLEPPRVPAVSDLSCRQDSEARDVTIEFRPPPGIDAVEVLRDGALVATLAGAARSHVDAGAPAGLRSYSIRGVKGGERGDGRECTLRVGPGSMAAREFLFPAHAVHQVTYDPVGDIYIAAANSPPSDRFLFRFDRDLRHLPGDLPIPFAPPRQVAALAARDAGGRTEIYCLGWLPGAPGGSQSEFPVAVIDATGRRLRQFNIVASRPRGNLVTFPSGMAWDAASDTFWFLERNAAKVVRITPAGSAIEAFNHPAPLYQDGVYNYGLAAAGDRGVLYLTSAGPFDHEITRLVEVTLDGQLTGVEIPLGPRYSRHWGFALEPGSRRFAVASHVGDVWDLVLHRAFDGVPPVEDLRCEPVPEGARLSWTNGGDYDAIAVHRGTEIAALLPGSDASWVDATPAAERTFYRVAARAGDRQSAGSACVPVAVRAFIRGDAEENGAVNISDAITLLNYLFLGGARPACLDAADVDDREGLNISDAISLLGFLFLAGRPPAAPFPEPGFDPTPDGLLCAP